MKTLIKNGRLINPKTKTDAILDIVIEDKLVVEIGETLTTSVDQIIDATGLVVVPGFVDLHVHFREPGFEQKEDISTGSYAAAKGGVTSVVCMPNTNPVLDNSEVIDDLYKRIEEKACIDVYSTGAITMGLKGEEKTDFQALKASGVIAFSDDGRTTMDEGYMKEVLTFAKEENLLVMTHSEDHEVSHLYKAERSPKAVEYDIVKRDIELCEAVLGNLHVSHVSALESIEYIKEARAKGLNVSGEAAPHHFCLSEEIIDVTSTYAKVNPPIRGEKDRKAVIEALRDGTLSCIATDHAPHEKELKECPYESAAMGISGIEISFAASYTELCKKNGFTLSHLINLMSTNPANLINIDRGSIEVGKGADIALIDLEKSFVVNGNDFVSKGKNTPMTGMVLYGVVEHTFKDGKIVYRREE